MLLAALPEPAAPLLDIGSGSGAPGLIVKLARPEWEVVLIEAVRRRANFLRHVSRRLAPGGRHHPLGARGDPGHGPARGPIPDRDDAGGGEWGYGAEARDPLSGAGRAFRVADRPGRQP